MLDLIPGMFPSAADPRQPRPYLSEPACGHGNFLVEILRRKLATATVDRYGLAGTAMSTASCVVWPSIDGIDIDAENVEDSRRSDAGADRTHTSVIRRCGPKASGPP